MVPDTPTEPSETVRPPVEIRLWRRRVHLLTASLVLDLCERRLSPEPERGELAETCVFAVVATGDGLAILAAALNRRFPSEAAVSSLDRAIEALARRDKLARAEFWKLHCERVVVVTDGQAPFTSMRFVEAVRDLGCVHRVCPGPSG